MSAKQAKQGNRPSGPVSGSAPINLERVPQLAPKFTNQLGKTATAFAVKYTLAGVIVEVSSLIAKDGTVLGKAEDGVTIPEWERRRALHNAPSETEKLTGMVRKYELRLNKECKTPPSSGSDVDIQAWLGKLGFAERRALLMSQKDFNKSYPEGFRA